MKILLRQALRLSGLAASVARKTIWAQALATLLALSYATQPAQAQTIQTVVQGIDAPINLAVDGHGNVFFNAFYGSNFTFDGAISEVQQVNGQPQVTLLGNGLGQPSTVAFDSHNNLFVVDDERNAIREYMAADHYGTATVLGVTLQSPFGIAFDKEDNLFVSSSSTVNRLAAPDYTSATVIGSFTAPTGLAIDGAGNVFVGDYVDGKVYEMLAAGGYATVNTVANGFQGINGVALDSAGDVFVADIAGTVDEIPVGGNGTVKTLTGALARPSGIVVDAAGNLFVTASQDGTLNELSAASNYADVTAVSSGLREPLGIALDSAGNLVVADAGDCAIYVLPALTGYSSRSVIVSNLALLRPTGLAVDAAGNVFVSDSDAIKEILAATGYTALVRLPPTVSGPTGIALDAAGDVIFSSGSAVWKIPAAGGYADVKLLAGNLDGPGHLTVDASGNVFVIDSDAAGFGSVKEIRASDGTVRTLGTPLPGPAGIGLDAADNVYVSSRDDNALTELSAASGYASTTPFGSWLGSAPDIAADAAGDIYVGANLLTAGQGGAILKILPTPPILAAAVLPGSRTIVEGATATVFATMINAGPTAQANCQIAIPGPDTVGTLAFTYQTTDPHTNAPTGTPNTPVTIPGNGGSQSYVLSFESPIDTLLLGVQLNFGCLQNGVMQAAPIVPGVNTVDLDVTVGQEPDIIALSATPSGDGIIHVPVGGDAAFAVATVDAGAAGLILVYLDTGSATLPITATLCETNPSTAQCLAPPASTLSLDIAANATPTFSVFLQSSGTIPFAPAASRIFVRFSYPPPPGYVPNFLWGSTSVAVESP